MKSIHFLNQHFPYFCWTFILTKVVPASFPCFNFDPASHLILVNTKIYDQFKRDSINCISFSSGCRITSSKRKKIWLRRESSSHIVKWVKIHFTMFKNTSCHEKKYRNKKEKIVLLHRLRISRLNLNVSTCGYRKIY